MESPAKRPEAEASKEQDVFETPDVPDEIQPENTETIQEAENENIERTKLSATEALAKFSKASWDPSRDFSDRIVKKRIKRGGLLGQKDYEMNGDLSVDVNETPVQKFHRLQFEVNKFLEFMNNLKEDKKAQEEKEKTKDVDPVAMAEELTLLQNQLQLLMKDETLQSILNPKYDVDKQALVQEGLTKKLLHELQSVSAKADSKSDSKSESPASSQVTYELYYTPDQSKYAQAAKVVALEKKVSELESILGVDKTANTTSGNLVSTIQELQEKISILSAAPASLENIQRRMKLVSQEMDALLEKKAQTATPSADINEKKVNEMFEIMTRWDVVAQQLPTIITRLQDLKQLHEDGASFQQTLQQLESQQDAIKKLLANNSELAKELDANFKQNMETVRSNFAALEKRFKELGNKMDDISSETY